MNCCEKEMGKTHIILESKLVIISERLNRDRLMSDMVIICLPKKRRRTKTRTVLLASPFVLCFAITYSGFAVRVDMLDMASNSPIENPD